MAGICPAPEAGAAGAEAGALDAGAAGAGPDGISAAEPEVAGAGVGAGAGAGAGVAGVVVVVVEEVVFDDVLLPCWPQAASASVTAAEAAMISDLFMTTPWSGT